MGFADKGGIYRPELHGDWVNVAGTSLMQRKIKQVKIDQYGFHLLRNFVLAGVASIVIVIAVLATLTYNSAVHNMIVAAEANNLTVARALSNHVWADTLDEMQRLVTQSADLARQSQAYMGLRADVGRHITGSSIIAIRVFSPRRQVLFSTDASQLGSYEENVTPATRALQSKSSAANRVTIQSESMLSVKTPDYWIRSYLPLDEKHSAGVNGEKSIVEVTSDVTSIHNNIIAERNNMIISIALVLLIVFSILFVFVRRASLIASRRMQEKLEDEAMMRHIAYHDALTGLPNREMFRNRLESAIARTERHESLLAIIFLDLDRFKHINDTLGHSAGDLLLKEVAVRLTNCLRQTDTLARQGGDEFTILLDGITHVDEVEIVIKRILAAFEVPVRLGDQEVMTSASMGVSIYPFDERDIDSLLRDADIAMYAAKAAGRDNYAFYTSEMSQDKSGSLEMENKLRMALEENEYILQYQPIVDVRKGQMIGVEALLRWNNQDYGIVSPDKFIPILEETGFITIVGNWVLRTACRKAVEWQQMGYDPIAMSVNISIIQFRRLQFVDTVRLALEETGLDPKYLKIEITESVLMDQNDASIKKLEAVKALGVSIAADDFGTGYSSLSYLKKLPIDILKIDRSFVMDIHKSQDGAAIATAIAALAHSLRLGIIAEGVEEIEELNFLVALSCNYIQGYFFSRPLFEDDLLAVMDDKDFFVNKLMDAREQNQSAVG